MEHILKTKLSKAAQALKKNHSLLVTSGTGMAAESGVPSFRGTKGLWERFPKLREHKVYFDDLVEEDFFRQEPEIFWYVYG